MSTMQQTDVLIIGAGPSGSSAAALLRQKGHQVTVIEKQYFPRFSIGESLLPQCMVFLEEAGLLETVRAHADEYAFQFKNGAAFLRGRQRSFMTLPKNLVKAQALHGRSDVPTLTSFWHSKPKKWARTSVLAMKSWPSMSNPHSRF